MITFVAVILLGFFLGMRHATDPDHVIAVSTIVSRHRAPRQAALIGMLWGLGHTFTVFLVGVVIILVSIWSAFTARHWPMPAAASCSSSSVLRSSA